MKYNWKNINDRINAFAQIEFKILYMHSIDPSWELYQDSPDVEYKVYIQYINPESIMMAIVADPPFLFSLSETDKKELE